MRNQPEPVAIMSVIRARDTVTIALEVLHALETLRPLHVPPLLQSVAMRELLERPPQSVPADMRQEHDIYVASRTARANAKAENRRRVRTTLWAEATLRRHGRQEHEIVRAFNRDEWHVSESAALDVAEREAQVGQVS